MWTRTGDPVRDADDFLRDEERRYERWMDGCPTCAICGNPIIHDECVAIDRWTKVCYACKVEQLEKAGKALNPYIVEILQDALNNLVTETPHEDVA